MRSSSKWSNGVSSHPRATPCAQNAMLREEKERLQSSLRETQARLEELELRANEERENRSAEVRRLGRTHGPPHFLLLPAQVFFRGLLMSDDRGHHGCAGPAATVEA